MTAVRARASLRYATFVLGMFTVPTASAQDQQKDVDYWVQQLNAHCFITPQSYAGQDLPAIMRDLKSHDFDSAAKRATGILGYGPATISERKCAEIVVAAIPTLQASSTPQVAAGKTESNSTPQQPNTALSAEKLSERKLDDGKQEQTEIKAPSSVEQVTADSKQPFVPQPVAVVNTKNADALPGGASMAPATNEVSWSNAQAFLMAHWLEFLVFYGGLLGLVAWRDRRGYDARWKSVASKVAFHTLALPFYLAFLAFRVVAYGLKQNLSKGYSTSTSSTQPVARPQEQAESINIECQDLSGNWALIHSGVRNDGQSIKMALRDARIGAGKGKRVRAVGSNTGRIYDLQ